MKLVRIDMEDDGETPAAFTFTMTLGEAGYVAKSIGGRADLDGDGDAVYDRISAVFNQFYESGIKGWVHGEEPKCP